MQQNNQAGLELAPPDLQVGFVFRDACRGIGDSTTVSDLLGTELGGNVLGHQLMQVLRSLQSNGDCD